MPLQIPNQGYLHPFTMGIHFLYGIGERPRTVTELAMARLSSEIRSKNDWWTTFPDLEWQENLIKEVSDRILNVDAPCGKMEVVLNPRQVQYVLDELAGYAKLRDLNAGYQVSCFERIWESNSLLAPELLYSLNMALYDLRNERPAPWDAMSYDLVDPFSHCLVYRHTLVRDSESGLHVRLPQTSSLRDAYAFSTNFACIPSTFSISPPSLSGSDKPLATCLSYINNIDPSYRTLYSRIEAVVSSTIPLFEHVLTDLHRNNPLPQRIPGSCRYTEWEEPDEPEDSDDDEGWLNYEREVRRWALLRPLKLPDIPDSGYPGGLEVRKHTVSLRGRKVKLTVRITDINLHPDGEPYTGMPFHVEGMLNDRVVACALHCLHLSNMKAPAVDFRMPVCSPRDFMPGDEGATMRTWGLRDGAACVQSLGGRDLCEGFSIAFPNIYQYRIGPSRLIDSTKPGSATILGLYLVDPDLDWDLVPSTLEVPPQQKSWMKQAVEESMDIRIPAEVLEQIVEMVEGVMTDEEAQKFARDMRKEREIFWNRHNQHWCCLPFDLWPSRAG